MSEMFLSFIGFFNDNRFWLGPILAICVLVLAAREVIGVVQEEIEDIKFHRRPRPWR